MIMQSDDIDLTYKQAIDRKARAMCGEIFDWLSDIGAITEESKQKALNRIDESFAARATHVEPVEECEEDYTDDTSFNYFDYERLQQLDNIDDIPF